MQSPGLVIVSLVVLALLAAWLLSWFGITVDRQALEDYGIRKGWTLKTVHSVPSGRRGRGYYRVTYVTSEGKKEKVWFETSATSEPELSQGPFKSWWSFF